MAEPGAIDIVVNPHTPLEVANDQVGVDVHFQDKVRMPDAMRTGISMGEYVDKCLFGTDWPVIDPERAMVEVEGLGLRPEAKRKFLRDNAIKLFKLPERAGAGTLAAAAGTA